METPSMLDLSKAWAIPWHGSSIVNAYAMYHAIMAVAEPWVWLNHKQVMSRLHVPWRFR